PQGCSVKPVLPEAGVVLILLGGLVRVRDHVPVDHVCKCGAHLLIPLREESALTLLDLHALIALSRLGLRVERAEPGLSAVMVEAGIPDDGSVLQDAPNDPALCTAFPRH